MKTLVLHEATDLATLARRKGAGTTVETLRRMNPHLTSERLAAGTLVLVPGDAAEQAAEAPGALHLHATAEELKAALEEALGASRRGLALRAGERKQVADALRVPAMKRVVEADPELRQRAEGLAARHREEVARDKAAEKALKQLQAAALTEIDGLLKRFG